MGLNGHKLGCPCPACRGAQVAEERRHAEAEQAATVRAVARLGAWMAAQLARSGGSAPDVLRQALGAEDARRVLRMAGQDAGVFPASEPVRGGPAQQRSGFWSQFPDHDPRFLSGQASLASVKAEYAERAAEKRHRDDVYHGRDVMPVAMGVSADERGVPVQRSVTRRDVPPLGSEV